MFNGHRGQTRPALINLVVLVLVLVECGVLVHKNGKESRRVVLDPDERTRVIASFHVVGGRHHGQTSTIRKVTDRFWWRNVASDIREFVRSCSLCQKATPVNRPAPAGAVGGVFFETFVS